MIISILIALYVLLLAGVYVFLKKVPVKLILRSKHHLESIFDSIPDPVAIIDAQRKVRRINLAYSKVMGKRFQDIIGKPCHGLFPQCESVCDGCLLEETMKSGQPNFLKGKKITRNGQDNYYDFYFFPLRDKKGGEITSVTEYIMNVTAETIAKMDLEKAKASLEEALSQVREEIDLAREIQQSILPTRNPEIEGVKISAYYVPAESVGGDLYDIIPLGGFRYGVFVGDVSGHGLPAAFVGAMTKMSLYTHARESYSPKEVLGRINEDLNKNISTGHYLTGIYGVLDLNENLFTYTRASHPFPLVVHADGSRDKLDTTGIFIGMVEDAEYGEGRMYMQPGDRLYLFTDGFYEFHNEDMVMLGQERFNKILEQNKNVPIEEVAQNVDDNVKAFYDTAVFDDDRTLVVLDITEKSRKDRFRLLCDFEKEDNIMVATFTTLDEAEGYISIILREMDAHGFPDEQIRRMKVVITELFANGIEHGNRNNPDKKLDIAVAIDNIKAKVACIDEGNGFRMENIPDPTNEENLMKERGRGLHIIKKFADDISQNEKGNRVTIVKYKKSLMK